MKELCLDKFAAGTDFGGGHDCLGRMRSVNNDDKRWRYNRGRWS